MQPVEQHIAVQGIFGRIVAGAVFQQQMTFHAELGRGRRGLAGVVGLGGALGDDGVGALRHRLAHQEFQFAGLVAAGGQAPCNRRA